MAETSRMKFNEPCNRLRGRLPRIEIRPAVDGRRKGIRESLESQTVEMARNAAKLFTKNLRHSNGLPVECVTPRRRESTPQAIGNAPPTDWTPAFAGMTGISKGMRFQMTPPPAGREPTVRPQQASVR